MNLEQLLIYNIGEERYNHSLRVVDTAIKLAQIYGADIDKAKIGALLHDCAKYRMEISLLKKISLFDIILDDIMIANKQLLHGPLGSKIAENEYGILDREILDSIHYHTTGRANMTLLDKIIYISDYIEPEREFTGIKEIRNMAFQDLDLSIIMAMDNTILFLVKSKKLIHPDTLAARNYLLMEDIIN